jgi:hypothetical protein
MIDYTLGLGDYWVRLIEQMIPASTLWLTGQKMENSIFHRQKVVWRRQRTCALEEVTCTSCQYNGQIFTYDCTNETVETQIVQDGVTFQQILNQTVNSVVATSGYTSNQCNLNSIQSVWYVDLRLDSQILIQQPFYNGYGSTDVPNLTQWINALQINLQSLYTYGLGYYINGNTLVVSNTNCYPNFTDKTLTLNVGVDITINCG